MKKKFTSILLILVMVATLLVPVPVFAAEASAAAFYFSEIPKRSENSLHVYGRVVLPENATNYSDYRLTAWVMVGGSWWGPKPSKNQPCTAISENGRFVLQFASYDAPTDLEANAIRVFLVSPSLSSDELQDLNTLNTVCAASSLIERSSGGAITVDGAPWPLQKDYAYFDSAFPGVRDEMTNSLKFSVNYSPYTERAPGVAPAPTEAQIRGQLSLLAEDFGAVRFFTVEDSVSCMYDVAQELGLNVIGTAWIDRTMSDAQIKAQLDKLVALANAGKVMIASVGSEVILRGDMTPGALLGYMDYVKQRLTRPVPVTFMDTSGAFDGTQNPPGLASLWDACDVILFSHYPIYSDNYKQPWMASYPGGIMQYAIDEISNAYKAVDNNVGVDQFGHDRPCLVAETGWTTAHDGAYNGLAEPSEANSREYWDRVQSWAMSKSIGLFWFSSFDEAWKPVEGGTSSKYFGIYDKDGNMKEAFADIKDANAIDVGVSAASSKPGWTYSGGVYTITGDATVKGSTGAPSNGNRIVISGGTAGKPLRVTLQDVTISATAPITLSAGSHAVLALNGDSVLISTNPGNAGIQTTNASLTIEAGNGTSSLDVTGGSDAAGIGGGVGADGGSIVVNSGAVTATGTYGAGIGGGRGLTGAAGSTAEGGSGGAGGDGGNVTVNGGSVTASSAHGAGIGGGAGGNGGNGGLSGRDGRAGGAGGDGGYGGTVSIYGGSVMASSTNGSGIGGGSGGAGGTGREGSGNSGLGATGGRGGDGGAGGNGGAGGGFSIDGGSVTARSDNARGIGGGAGGAGGAASKGGQGGTGGGSGQGGKPGAAGSPGGMGSITVSAVYDYTWWGNTANSDPGGLGTSYQNETQFSNNDTYKYVRIEMSTDIWQPWETDRLNLQNTMPGMGESWTYNGGVFTVTGDVMITGSTGTSPSNGNRVVLSGGTPDKPLRITLQNATIHAGAPIVLNPGSHAILVLSGSSELAAANVGSAGICTDNAFLTIEAGTGEATLDVRGGDDAAGIGGNRGADGIGGDGGSGGDGGNVTINGGTVTASSVNGAGIGGGRGGDGSYISAGGGTGGTGGAGGAVTINAGNVTATSTSGAGIGGGQGGLGGESGTAHQGREGGIGGAGGTGIAVRINGGSVIATSVSGAGIGGGSGNTGGKGGDGDKANGLWNNGYGGGHGGKGGDGGNGGSLTIGGGTVTARSGGGMGIGGGSGGMGGSGGKGGRGGDFGGSSGSNGGPGAVGAVGGTGTFSFSQVSAYTWWANTTNSNPEGAGTAVPGGAAFLNSGTYKFVKLLCDNAHTGGGGVLVTGKVRSYNPKNTTTIRLMQGDNEMYKTVIEPSSGSGQLEQAFAIEGVAPGTYALVINKPAHTSFTVQTVVVGDENVDLAQDARPEVKLMTLRCGDINGDNMINDGDLSILWMAANYNRSASAASSPLCDLNGDGMINDGDLTVLWMIANYNRGGTIIP